MSNPEADRNPDLITGLIIDSKSLFPYSEGAFFKEPALRYTHTYFFLRKKNRADLMMINAF